MPAGLLPFPWETYDPVGVIVPAFTSNELPMQGGLLGR